MRYKIEPWPHQLEAIEASAGLDEFGLFFEMGTGKTLALVNMLRTKYFKHTRLLRTLIVAPSVTLENWRREIIANSNVKPDKILVVAGSRSKREMLRSLDKDGEICILTYETLRLGYAVEHFTKVWKPEIVVLDEAHRIRNRGASARAAWLLADESLYRYILTGSPIIQDVRDLWSQIRFLDRGTRFGRNFWKFMSSYFYARPRPGTTVREFLPLPESTKKLTDTLATITRTVKKSECLTLPPVIRQVVPIEMSPEQKDAYDRMFRDFVAIVGDRVVTAGLVLTRGLRLQQIVAGFVPMEKDEFGKSEIHKFRHNPRLEALSELLPELTVNNKVIIWSCWVPTYADIVKACGDIPHVMLTGETPQPERQKAIDAFQNDPKVRVFIGNPGAAGVGVNLTAGSAAIWYTRNFKLEHEIQGDARNNRAGAEQHETLLRYDFVTTGTLDEDIAAALARKQQIGDKLLLELAKKYVG